MAMGVTQAREFEFVHAVRIKLRHFVASAMLAAMMSLIFHGGVAASLHQHASGSLGCGLHASTSGHSQASADHDHGGERFHDVDEASPQAGSTDQEGATPEPCCGSMCSIAISTRGPDKAWTPFATEVAVAGEPPARPDNRPDGLKRPPRASDTA